MPKLIVITAAHVPNLKPNHQVQSQFFIKKCFRAQLFYVLIHADEDVFQAFSCLITSRFA